MNNMREQVMKTLSRFEASTGTPFPKDKSYKDITRFQITNYLSDADEFTFSLLLSSKGKERNNKLWIYPTKLSIDIILKFQKMVRDLIKYDANNAESFLGDFASTSPHDESDLSCTTIQVEPKLSLRGSPLDTNWSPTTTQVEVESNSNRDGVEKKMPSIQNLRQEPIKEVRQTSSKFPEPTKKPSGFPKPA